MPADLRLSQLPQPLLLQRMQGAGLRLRTGPFVMLIRSPNELIAEGLGALYGAYPVESDDTFAEFALNIAPGKGLRRWLRPQVRFVFDGRPVFEPLPADQAFVLLEWAMNWCISNHAHQYLIVHAAVVARGDRAMVLPAPPGSGKSTLCAALIHSGWRLLSDELTLIGMDDGLIVPLCRPVSLKNQSIDVIQRFAPDARFNRITHDTAKGSVTHMAVPADQLHRIDQKARPCWVVYPRYAVGAATELMPRPRAGAVEDLARNSFNFAIQSGAGFKRLCDLVEGCACYDFRYSDLRSAMAAFDALAADPT